MVTINQILDGRRLIDAYRAAQAENPDAQELIDKLKTLGFESIQGFFDANEYANHIERIKSYALSGDCDDCEGRSKGCLQNCQLGYLNSVIAVAPDAPKLREGALKIKDTSNLYRTKALNGDLTKDQVRKIFAFFYTWRNYPDNVPPGCSCKFVKIKEPDFDIYWMMPPGIILKKKVK